MVLVRGYTRCYIFRFIFWGILVILGILGLLSMFWFHSKEIREQGKASMWPVCLAMPDTWCFAGEEGRRHAQADWREDLLAKQCGHEESSSQSKTNRRYFLSWLLLCGGHLLVRSHFAKVEHWKWMACNRIASLMPVQASMESIPQGCATPRSMLQANAGIGYCKICRKEAPRSRAHIAGELQNLLNLATATAAANRHISQWVTPWTGKWYDCRNSCLWRITFLFGFQDFPKMMDYWLMIK